MTYAFDTLGYAKRLREAGVPSEQAEAHAEAAREFVMGELVTRFGLERAQRETDGSIAGSIALLRKDIALSESRTELVIRGLENKYEGVRQELESQRRDFANALSRMTLQMTVRLGGMIAVAVAILATIMKL